MGEIVVTNSVSFILVFMEGLLSFFSPCVIPLIPIYMSYLAGNGKKVSEEGVITYDRGKVFLHTLCFTIGISFAFFILGITFTAFGGFLSSNRLLFTRIGGIIILVLGLVQLGVLDLPILQRERRIHFKLSGKKMNPLVALVMGFTFSFAWTPCVGPALTSVLTMAMGAKKSLEGMLLVLVYTIGFLIPFLLLGLFTTQVLNFLKIKQNLIRYTVKIGGVILIIMGIMVFTGWMNNISCYLNHFTYSQQEKDKNTKKENNSKDRVENNGNKDDSNSNADMEASNENSENEANSSTEEKKIFPSFDFTLTDQYGNTHTLSDYKGKVVFLNFWATWCPPCKEEMPDIEELYQEFNLNQDEVIILGVANPSSDEYPRNADESKEEIISFLEEKGYTFPVVFDETGEVLTAYRISAFPTTFLINKEGNIYGYVPGMMTKDIMLNVINQALESTK